MISQITSSYRWQLGLFCLLSVAVVLLSLGFGAYHIRISDVLKALISPLAPSQLATISSAASIKLQIIYQIRLPRILMAWLAGAGLALCGSVLQGLFRNPLVDPHIIGVSSGAALGGSVAILLGLSGYALLGLTFVTGMLALFLVLVIASFWQQQNRLALILAGVILSGFCGALVSLVQFCADNEEQLPTIVYWLLGSFANANWAGFCLFAPAAVIASAILLALRWRLNVLSLDEQESQLLDPRTHQLRLFMLTLCAVIVAAQVAVSGCIGWIGLVVPHISRWICGENNQKSLPMSVLIGATLMVIIDDIARTISASEIPIGILTALIGTILVVLLLWKKRVDLK